ncbi:unnamed protein product, partial [Ectocarpus fasciculatus]
SAENQAPQASPPGAPGDAGPRHHRQRREQRPQGAARVDVSSREASLNFLVARDVKVRGERVPDEKAIWRCIVDKKYQKLFKLRSSLPLAVSYQEREWAQGSQGRCQASPAEKARAENKLAPGDQHQPAPDGVHYLYDNLGTGLCRVKTSLRHAIRLQSEIYHRAGQERQLRQPVRLSQHLPPPPVVGNRVWEPIIGSDVELLLPKALAGGAVKDVWYRVRVCELDSNGKVVFGFLASQARTEKITKFSSVYDYDEVVRKKGYAVRPGTHLTWKFTPISAGSTMMPESNACRAGGSRGRVVQNGRVL